MIGRGLGDDDWRALAKLAYEIEMTPERKPPFDALAKEAQERWIDLVQQVFREGLAKLLTHLAEPDGLR